MTTGTQTYIETGRQIDKYILNWIKHIQATLLLIPVFSS